MFPGASHCRFEHSLGVCHLADKWVKMLKETHRGLEIRDHDVSMVRLAGLCHDLGHGPFSHVWDSVIVPRR